MIEVSEVFKAYRRGASRVEVLRGVTCAVGRGEFAFIVGPSGSGKTTLLSILGCILSPTEGALTIAGNSTAGLGPEGLADIRRKHVGFVFQSYNLVPTLTAMENVMLALDLRGASLESSGAG